MNDLFLLNAISTEHPHVVLDGAGGLDTLDARNVFAGSGTMFITDTVIDGVDGFTVGDFEAVNFEQVYGNSTKKNWFLLQQVDHAVTLHGGSADDWFAASFGEQGARTADTFYGYDGDDFFNVRQLDQAYGGDGNDTFELSSTSEDVSGSVVSGGDGTDTLELSFGWTVDLTAGFADSPFSGSDDRYVFSSIENVEVYAWRSYFSQVTGSAEDNVFTVNKSFDDGSKGVFFDGLGGEDTLVASRSADTLYGGSGDDKIYSRLGADTVFGGDGDDYVRVGGGEESFYGGAGQDYISYYSSASGVTVNLATNEVSRSWASNDVIDGFESVSGSKVGGDHITGTSSANKIQTYGGADSVFAGKGNDKVYLGAGDDYVRAGGGAESFYGGSGKDYLSYYDSASGVRVDLDASTVAGSWASNDVIDGFESAAGSRTGDDKLYGTSGSNSLKSYGGADKLYGRSGDDKLVAGSGDDRLDGGHGADLLYGGAGVDIFHFDHSEDADVIMDFEDDMDTIELDNFDFTTVAQALSFAQETRGHVVFDFGHGDILTVENVTKAQLQDDLAVV